MNIQIELRHSKRFLNDEKVNQVFLIFPITDYFPFDFPQGVRTPNTTEKAKRTPPKKQKGPSIPRTIRSEAVVGGGPKERPTEVIDASSKTRASTCAQRVCSSICGATCVE